MPSRHLPEMGRARQQRDLSVERRLRFLARRTRYPSVSRSTSLDQIDVNTGSTAVYLSLTVDRGGWLILASLNIFFEAGTNGEESATMTVFAYAEESGDLLATVTLVRWRRDGGITDIREQMSNFAHYRAEERTRFDLQVSVATVGPSLQAELHNLQLIAVPL